MKNIPLALGAFLYLIFPVMANATTNSPVSTNTLLTSVVVYRVGAELTHTARVTLPDGNVVLALEKISNDIDANSVQIHVPNGVTLLGFTYENDFLSVPLASVRQHELEDSLDRLQANQDKIGLSLTNTDDLLDVLKKNRDLKGAQTGMNVTDLMRLMEYYKTKSAELTDLRYELKKKQTTVAENIEKVKAQIKEEETQNTRESGRLLLHLAVTNASVYDFTVSYITHNAGWSPAYELRVTDGVDSLNVIYKANINQSTGLDWRRVKMSLSTSVPGSWSQAPELNPEYIGFLERRRTALFGQLSGAVAGISITPALDETAAAQGYAQKKRQDEELKSEQSDSSGTQVFEQRLNTVYTIDLPYDLPSTGKDQTVPLQNMGIFARFKYFAVPKISADIYLLADIPDWGKLDLLPGQANIILNGTYEGLTSIDPSSTLDTLHLTIGKDKRINIDRQKVADVSSEKFLNGNQYHRYAYDITVRNNKRDAITLSILDQIPLTNNKNIEVTLNASDSAILNNDKGELRWTIPLSAGESRKIHFGYTLKYPKEESITVR